MKYLIDEALLVESAIEEEVNESSGKKEKNYYIQGVFSTPGQKNRNGRIYPMNIWEREVAKYQQCIANNAVETLGEWEHPSRSSVDPLQAVMKMVEVKMDNGLVIGKAKILNNNSEKTNQLKALIDEGMKIGVSSRGVGSVRGDIVENFNLITWDAVASPSDYNSNLSGICESMQDKNFLITESGEIKEVLVEQTEIKEPTEPIVEAKKELTLEEKKIAAEKFMSKFSEILGTKLTEGIKVNSPVACVQALQIALGKITDEKAKGLLQSAIDYLAKEYKINLNEAKMIKNKFKKGQIVQFYDAQGKKAEGHIIKFEYDEMENGNWSYFYNIEGLKKEYKDVPEGDIIK